MMGTLVVDERIFQIHRIELDNGRINFWFDHLGALDLPAHSEVRVHAADGTLIATAPWVLSDDYRKILRALRPVDEAHVCFPMRFRSVDGWPAQPRAVVAQGA